jgi:hypothetical protein
MDIMRPLASIRIFQQVPASMELYLLGVQERLASLEHLTFNTSIAALCSLAQYKSHRLAMQSGRSIHIFIRLLKEAAVTSMVNTSVLRSMVCAQIYRHILVIPKNTCSVISALVLGVIGFNMVSIVSLESVHCFPQGNLSHLQKVLLIASQKLLTFRIICPLLMT